MTEAEKKNVIDYYWYWNTQHIKASLDEKRHKFSILISNRLRDFNIGTVIRNNNAFLGKEIYVLGNRKYDRRGTVGTHHYENLKFIKSLEELPKIPIISIDNVGDAKPIDSFEWPNDEFIMAFGQEQVGVPQDVLDASDDIVYIKQFGSVRSLNVGTAAGIAMYDYTSKMCSKGL